jgi:hypothetical protein
MYFIDLFLSFSISISLDIVSAIAQLFPALFQVQSFAILHQSSFLTFARFLWIEVSLHIAEMIGLRSGSDSEPGLKIQATCTGPAPRS